jgi:glycosyltransferase involved in cell wall biosynthesis
MKVGIIVSTADPETGGSFSFQNSILGALSFVVTKHKFIILSKSDDHHYINNEGIEVVGLKPKIQHNESRSTKNEYKTKSYWMRFLKSLPVSYTKKQQQPVTNAQPISDTPLLRAIKKQGIDVVWFLSPMGEVVPCPMFVTVWDLQHRLQPWFPEVSWSGLDWQSREDLYQRILPRASKVITGTLEGKEEVVHFYRLPSENVAVIPFPSPPVIEHSDSGRFDIVKTKYNLLLKYFFYPAQFWPHKNHPNLLRGMVIAKDIDPTIPDLVFTGSDKGNMSYILKLIQDLGLKENVHILGFVPKEDLTALYKCADAMIFPTFFGPDNLPPLEAFSLGCPVMASNVSGSQEQLGDAVIFFKPSSPQDIAKAMLTLHHDDALKKKLRDRGFERASKFNALNYIEKIISLLNDFGPIIDSWESGYGF